MMLVLGIDAATWTMIRPNRDKLPAFARLCEIGQHREIILDEDPLSAPIWCSMFSGRTAAEHGHRSFVREGKLVRREDIRIPFIWDVVQHRGKIAKALNVPFVVPPYSFGVDFKPVGFGLPTNDREWRAELERVTDEAKRLLHTRPDLLVVAYTLLDRVQHFHWGESCVLEWYRRLDQKMEELIFESGFLPSTENSLIVISDHGFCAFGEAKLQTLPLRSEWGELKGDHHEQALLITVNVDSQIHRPEDVYFAVETYLTQR